MVYLLEMVIFHSYVSLPEGITMWGPPVMWTLVYNPHEYYTYLRTINHSEIGVMFTNLAI